MSKADQKEKLKDLKERIKALSRKPSRFDQTSMAERSEHARLLLHEAYDLFDRRSDRPEEEALWREAVALNNELLEQAYPEGFWDSFESLRKGDLSGLEVALRFLEADPWFFGSGYVKADLIRFVCRCPLTSTQAERLRSVVLNAIELRDRREFRQFANLGKVVQSEDFKEELSKRLLHEDEGVRRRARWVLDLL